MQVLIITGPPFSGKGTQCKILHDSLGYKHISTGDRCREEKARGTEIGKLISEYNDKGELVPDAIMKNLFEKVIDENLAEKGIILDGYPRTTPQVTDLIALIAEKDLRIHKVLNLEVPDEELLKRAKERAKNSDRKDDQDVNTHIKRIEIFREITKPSITFMKSQFDVHSISGMGSIVEISLLLADGLKK